MKVRTALQMLLTMSLSSIGTLYLAYLAWRYAQNRKRRSVADQESDNDNSREPRLNRSESNASFDTNIIWTVVRPVLTQVIASALQDRATQNAFRNCCVGVLADEKMNSCFREAVKDVLRSQAVQESAMESVVALSSSEKVARSVAILIRNACSDDQAALGLSKLLAKTLAMLSEESSENGRRVLTDTLRRLVTPEAHDSKESSKHVSDIVQ